MRIAICGKGGSGKSTVSFLLTKYLAERGEKVLAIDADYNMDLAHNLGWTEAEGAHFVSQAEADFYRYQGLSESDRYLDLPKRADLRPFSFHPHDDFTRKVTRPAGENISLMIAGPTHPDQLYGHRCGHAYFSPVKYYLPLVETAHPVIIDSVAGTDMVSYGLYLGADAVVVAVEPTPNSVGVFGQICGIAQELEIPVFAVLNKFAPGRAAADAFSAEHGERILGRIPADVSLSGAADWDTVSAPVREAVAGIWRGLSAQGFDAAARWRRFVRWREKYDRQQERVKDEEYSFVA